jgi:hypothetical protein
MDVALDHQVPKKGENKYFHDFSMVRIRKSSTNEIRQLAGRRTRISFKAQVVNCTDSKGVSRRLGGRDRQVADNTMVATWEKCGDGVLPAEFIRFLTMVHLGAGLRRNRGRADPHGSSSENRGRLVCPFIIGANMLAI